MRRWFPILGLVGLLATFVAGNEVALNEKDEDRQRCSGMYSKKSWGGSTDPFILLKFNKDTSEGDTDPLVGLVIFEWKDEHLIGRYRDGTDKLETICDRESVDAGLCEENDLGSFILSPNATESKNPIIAQAVHLKDPPAINYPVRQTGFYCVSTFAQNVKYEAVVEWRNAFGELPAAQIPKLPFYGGLTITYAVLGAFWAFLYVQNRSDILPVQNYITATIIFLIVEQLMTWGFYDYQNRNGSNAAAKALMTVVAILNAGRNSLSFFLLLIVCMGYGVVKPSLGRTMIYVRFLAIGHFVFGVIYAIASLSITPDSAGPLVLLVILPLAGTLTAFYVWTLNSLNMTKKELLDRKQKVKYTMYQRLWWCILGSILVIFGFFFINSFAFAGRSEANFVPEHWQTRWFVLDGWLNLVYLCDIAFIAYLWRPTANNRRFAMSDEIAQDDDGFEIRSLADSLDEEDPMAHSPTVGGVHADGYGFAPGAGSRGASPNPRMGNGNATTGKPRESLDGETIFAVGEEGDRFSDSDEDDDSERGERKKLASQGV
ncbi:MAG: hypothetical protein Q9227_008411 [Pyrenula ochraceoflavens]